MEYARLGRSGLQISKLVLGTMNFGNPTDERTAGRVMHAALDAGINCIDCADVYAGGKSEAIVGRALKAAGRRKDVILTSKVFWPTGGSPNEKGLSQTHIFKSCDESLKRLKIDTIDIYYMHRIDFNVPLEESLHAMDLLVKQGKIRHVGCSTFPPWKTVEALWIADRRGYPPIVCEQPPYNLLDRRAETEILPMCAAFDLGVMTWSPLAQGILAGRYTNAEDLPRKSRGALKSIFAERITQDGIEVAQHLASRAESIGCSLAQFATAWLLSRTDITGLIIGPRTLNHLTELLNACQVKLNASDMEYCDTLVPPGSWVSDHFNTAGWKPIRSSEKGSKSHIS